MPDRRQSGEQTPQNISFVEQPDGHGSLHMCDRYAAIFRMDNAGMAAIIMSGGVFSENCQYDNLVWR